jgi:hypothetical protein
MPPRPSHLPHNIERNALLRLRARPDLAAAQLHPAGRKTIATMMAKGWIESAPEASSTPRYRITLLGEAALTAEIPITRTPSRARIR